MRRDTVLRHNDMIMVDLIIRRSIQYNITNDIYYSISS